MTHIIMKNEDSKKIDTSALGSQRGKAIEMAIAQIEKQFGKGSIMKLGEKQKVDIDVIPTGALSLDIALGVGGIPKGRIIEIYGPESSGKTTLAKMIVNFFEPYKGHISINHQDIKNIDKKILRRHINYLPQQAYIFNGSILENLTLGGNNMISQEDILKACELAEIRQDIERMPMGYQTQLSDGAGLSGGQKQRIALARALLTKAPVLILDEATSGLDVLTEKKVIDNLMSLTDKTILFVAHRLSIAERTNRVIVLDQGKIIEVGSHKELIQAQGFYHHLFNK